MRKSWLEQHPRSKIPLGCLTLLVLIGMFIVLLMTVITTSFRGSDVYKQAMAQAAANSQVRAQIGEPIKADWLLSGETQGKWRYRKRESVHPHLRLAGSGDDSSGGVQERRGVEVHPSAGECGRTTR